MAAGRSDVAGVTGYDPTTRSFTVLASTRAPVKGFEPAAEGEEPTERLEVLESWDLRRFLENPVVLRDHRQDDVGAIIGKASEIRETPEGLEMRITLASPAANPDIEQIEALLLEDLLRGVSVGFTFGERSDEERDGQVVAVFRNNILNEVSLVTVPADAGALVRKADAADGSKLDIREHAFRVWVLRERWLKTGDGADERAFLDADADYRARIDCTTCERAGALCRCTVDAPPPTTATNNNSHERYDSMSNEAEEAARRLRERNATRATRPLSEVPNGLSKQTARETTHLGATALVAARRAERTERERVAHQEASERVEHRDSLEDNRNAVGPNAPVQVCVKCGNHFNALSVSSRCPNCAELAAERAIARFSPGGGLRQIPPAPQRSRGAFDRPKPDPDEVA